MRWKAPSERTQLILLSPIIVPVAIVGAGVIAFGLPIIWLLDRLFPARDWHEWFAWRPVRIVDWDALEGTWYWLERVERRTFGINGHGAAYRLKEQTP